MLRIVEMHTENKTDKCKGLNDSNRVWERIQLQLHLSYEGIILYWLLLRLRHVLCVESFSYRLQQKEIMYLLHLLVLPVLDYRNYRIPVRRMLPRCLFDAYRA